jgi:mannonate dehydratase
LDDLDWIFSHQPSILNGLTYCSGSLSANTVNDPVEMVEKYKERVHFAHLRNTLKNEKGDFFESGHLSGNLNLPEIIYILLKEQIRRKNEGRDDFLIPVRPDHGVKILDDFQRDAPPGYPLIGRYRGLLEIAGIESGLSFMMQYE